jgi:hypothetical protein
MTFLIVLIVDHHGQSLFETRPYRYMAGFYLEQLLLIVLHYLKVSVYHVVILGLWLFLTDEQRTLWGL